MILEHKKGNISTVIASSDSYNDICKHMKKFLDDIGFKVHYFRTYMPKDELIIDYGSHVDFFRVIFNDDDERNRIKKELKL